MLTSKAFFINLYTASNTRKDISILLWRLSLASMCYILFIVFNHFYHKIFNKGISIYNGVFQYNNNIYIFNVFILLVTTVIITLGSFYSCRNVIIFYKIDKSNKNLVEYELKKNIRKNIIKEYIEIIYCYLYIWNIKYKVKIITLIYLIWYPFITFISIWHNYEYMLDSFLFTSDWWKTVMEPSPNSGGGPGGGPGSPGPNPGPGGLPENIDPHYPRRRETPNYNPNHWSSEGRNIETPIPAYSELGSLNKKSVDTLHSKVMNLYNQGQWVGKKPVVKDIGLNQHTLLTFKWIMKTYDPIRFEELWNKIGNNNYRHRQDSLLDGTEIDVIRRYINGD